jgi:hypothetical protein
MQASPWVVQINLVVFHFRHFICMPGEDAVREPLGGQAGARTDEYGFAGV